MEEVHGLTPLLWLVWLPCYDCGQRHTNHVWIATNTSVWVKTNEFVLHHVYVSSTCSGTTQWLSVLSFPTVAVVHSPSSQVQQ